MAERVLEDPLSFLLKDAVTFVLTQPIPYDFNHERTDDFYWTPC